MPRLDPATTAATAFGVGILLLGSLAGCAALGDAVSKQHREQFDSYDAAVNGWVGVDLPAWIPADATNLRNLATTDETVSVVRVASHSALAGDCVLSERRGIPTLTADWADLGWETYGYPKRVQRCGDYEVTPTDDGWLGWYTATEPGKTPG